MYLPSFVSEPQHLRSTLWQRLCKALVAGQGETGKGDALFKCSSNICYAPFEDS